MISRTSYLLFTLLTLVLVGCGGPDRDPNTVVIHFLNEPPSLHPITETNTYTGHINGLCHQMMMAVDMKTGKMIPELCAAPPIATEDQLSFTYQLHKEAAWPDGAPITGEDVLFSYKLLICPLINAGQRAAGMDLVSNMQVDANDPLKVEMQFSEFSLINGLLGGATFVLDKRQFDPEGVLEKYSWQDLQKADSTIAVDEALATWADKFNNVQTGMDLELLSKGSGPYVVREWIPEQQIILTPRENFWAKGRSESLYQQGPSKIIAKAVKDDKVVELQFKQQELDLSYFMTNKTYQAVKSSPAVQEAFNIDVVPRNSYGFIALNNNADGTTHKRFFQDKALRLAMTKAIPIEQIIEEVFPGAAERSTTPIPSHHPDYNSQITPYPHDVEAARKELDALGWQDTDGDRIRDKVVNGVKEQLSFTMLYPPNGQDLITIAERVTEEWRKVGIECELVQQTFAEIVPKIFGKDYDAAMIALSTPAVPYYDFTQIFWSQADRNFLSYANPMADSLMQQANRVPHGPERKEIVDKIQEIIYADQPCIFFFTATRKVALHKRFGDIKFEPNDPFIYLNTLKAEAGWEWDGKKWAK